MKNKWFLSALAVIGLGISAQANTVTWSFLENGTGNLGNSSTFTESGISLTAYGFTSANVATALWGKNDGPGETGLGIASDGDHEINPVSYVQINMTPLLNSTVTSILFGSVQSGETALVYFSSSLGSLGSFLGTITSDTTFTVPLADLNGYIGVTAGGSNTGNDPNVLISTLSATVPVPDGGTTVALLGGALLGLGLLKRKLA
jgi:hypothetical protein